jgi:hypothetical protein
MVDTPKKPHGERGVNRDHVALGLAAWDHKPGDLDPDMYWGRGYRENTVLSEVNQPSSYERLAEEEKTALQSWIREALAPSNEVGPHGSYSLKHILQRLERLYVTNGQFKGAMLIAGYEPVDRRELIWQWCYACDPELWYRSVGRAGRKVV